MLPLKKGAFHLALVAGVPIVPIVIENYQHAIDISGRLARGGDVHAVSWMRFPPRPERGQPDEPGSTADGDGAGRAERPP